MSIKVQIVEQKMTVFDAIVEKKMIIIDAIVEKKRIIDNMMRRTIKKRQVIKDE